VGQYLLRKLGAGSAEEIAFAQAMVELENFSPFFITRTGCFPASPLSVSCFFILCVDRSECSRRAPSSEC
jgi:hypothetical protein